MIQFVRCLCNSTFVCRNECSNTFQNSPLQKLLEKSEAKRKEWKEYTKSLRMLSAQYKTLFLHVCFLKFKLFLKFSQVFVQELLVICGHLLGRLPQWGCQPPNSRGHSSNLNLLKNMEDQQNSILTPFQFHLYTSPTTENPVRIPAF